MASLTRLRRRLARWDRYTARTNPAWPAPGHGRAAAAVWREQDRRSVGTVYWPTVTRGDLDGWGRP